MLLVVKELLHPFRTEPEQSSQFHRYAFRQSVLVQVQCDEPLPERYALFGSVAALQ